LVTSCNSMNDKPHSPHITTTAAAEVRTDGAVVARARAASFTSTLNDAAGSQLVEGDSKQEWEIRDIIGKTSTVYTIWWNGVLRWSLSMN
jgi:hypothetical protein